MMKKCKCVKCGESREANFLPNNRSTCKECINKRFVAYQRAHPEQVKEYNARRRAKPGYREKQAKFYKEWYAQNGRNRADDYSEIICLWAKEHPESGRAKARVAYAIKKGLLTRPLRCTLCGKEGRINGHHEDYDLPYEILWVCSSCHKKVHLGIRTLDKRDFI